MDQMKQITGIDIAVAEICSALKNQRDQVKEALVPYVNGAVTADTIKDWKAERARINKEKTAVDGARKTLEKEWKSKMGPVADAYKDIVAEYQTALDNIDSQLEAFEEERKGEKAAEICNMWTDDIKVPEEISEWVKLDDISSVKWLNATYAMSDIKAEMQDYVDNLKLSYDSIMGMNSEFIQEGLKVLKETRDFRLAVTEITRLQQMKDAIEAKRQIEEAARKQAEEEAREKAQAEAIRQAEEKARAEERAKIKLEEESKLVEFHFEDTAEEIEFRMEEQIDEEADFWTDDEFFVFSVKVPVARRDEFAACMESYGFEEYWEVH